MYVDSLTTKNGCDSIIRINLTVKATSTAVNVVQLCSGDTLFVGPYAHTTSNIYFDTLQTATGCDSVIISDVTVLDTFQSFTSVSLCFGETYEYRGTTYTESGVYVESFQTGIGCDSTYILDLYIQPDNNYFVEASICLGDSFNLGDTAYSDPGIYVDSLLNAQGCDSIVHLTLAITDGFVEEYDFVICRGDTLFFGLDTFTQAGIYIDSLQAKGGCDSIVKIRLNIVDFVPSMAQYTLCYGDSLVVGNNIYKVSGIFRDTIAGPNCDTIAVSLIKVLEQIVLDSSEIFLNINTDLGSIKPYVSGGTPPYRYRWNTGTDSQLLDNIQQGQYSVVVTDSLFCTAQFDFQLDTTTSFGDLQIIPFEIHAYPNPVRNDQILTIRVESSISDQFQFQIQNLFGKVIRKEEWNIWGETEKQIQLPGPSGMYLLYLSDSQGRRKVKKVIVP
jgi:hypothetical protein